MEPFTNLEKPGKVRGNKTFLGMSHVMPELNFLRFDDLDAIILWMIVQLYHFTNLKKWRAKTY